MGPDQDRQAMAAIALLAGELRQRLYGFVAAQSGPVTRDQAAAGIRISRKLAAIHLDKLVAQLLAGTGRAVGPRRWRRFAFVLLACAVVCFNQL
jgi:predicted ArsR family transcriptional regulator